ncbi:hypothetical protein IFM89_008217 [Coptis chinensis]|uniref:FAR1 domain-containing protein n=1 Tax=Coptis chinensis TaxID=261450 RepID=A0A835M1X7_9MAGN|nr:hypothetical protein IFM89_008217 [Coptis chinensis]
MTNRIRLDDDEEFLRSLCFESFGYDESDSLDVESTVSLMENENIDSSDSDAEESDTYRAYIEDKTTFLSMQFKTSDEAYTIYNEYAKSVGFSVRKDVYRIHPNGVAIKRRFVCSSQGQRHADKLQSMTPKRTPRQATRLNCKACIVVVFDSEAKFWTVKEFIGEHTHPLVRYPSSMFLRSHRNVSREALEFATCLNDVGVRKCQVMGHYAHIARCFLNVGFTKKDLYNKMGKERRSRCIDGDANTLLANLEDKVKLDPLFHYNYELNVSGQIIGRFGRFHLPLDYL